MVNVKHKRCECGKAQPNFNYPGEKAGYCSKCKHHGMVNVKYKKRSTKINNPSSSSRDGKQNANDKRREEAVTHVSNSQANSSRIRKKPLARESRSSFSENDIPSNVALTEQDNRKMAKTDDADTSVADELVWKRRSWFY